MKPTTHATITRLAIQYCKEKISSSVCKNTHEIIQGTIDEDEAIMSIVKRGTNWHFYRSENSPAPKRVYGLFKTTSEDILNERIKTLYKKEKGSKKFYNCLGRIIHHIQDMSTPSHVIPIYHGPELPFKIRLSMIDDHFESFLEENDCRISLNDIENQIDIDGLDEYIDFVKIYEASAEDMLKNILMINNELEVEDRPYSIFWKHYTEDESKKVRGFGVYGSCHEYFKELPENNPYEITKEDLYQIQDAITTHAIVSTCKAILLADRILRSSNE